jgi:hypothetical protein
LIDSLHGLKQKQKQKHYKAILALKFFIPMNLISLGDNSLEDGFGIRDYLLLVL